MQSGATRIIITWEPVNSLDRNSIITGYTVYYRAVSGPIENRNELMIRVDASVTRVEISNLEEHVTYNFSVSANSSVGEGPRSKGVLEKIAQGGEY